MKKLFLITLFLLSAGFTMADIVVTKEIKGPIKYMNAVNNGPVRSGTDQTIDNFAEYKAAHIPFARIHDAAFCAAYGGEHVVDITSIFPDFAKDVNDPDSYDFTLTDIYLKNIQDAGTNVFYRLGQKIEHAKKKYGIYPPKDYKKWAQICEHIIRHYTEGWNNGYHWNIPYWEIWNEPDLDEDGDRWKTDPRTWGGTAEQFFEFYKTVAQYLKSCFPNQKIGGPALCCNDDWGDRFLAYMHNHNVKMDFFSWHIYAQSPLDIANKADRIRTMMKIHGYGDIESILNEWNYVKGWTKDYPYSIQTINNQKGAAFTLSTMIVCQDKPVDMLMYYDARVDIFFNGLFDSYTLKPRACYYGFYAWNKLIQLGQQLKVNMDEKDVYVTAAQGKDGKIGILISRYSNDDNTSSVEKYKISIANESIQSAIGHLTDTSHLYTEVPVNVENGEIEVLLEPNAFIFIEI
ncbi:MAG: GH39 family glycosyl hydrolase [Phocaeicola sp.]|uniref:GH39 family glycosyl hydrolase n=1 Tax=Phocaeicola sp. TaxID=2773926 RepID=UPI003FA0AA9B